MENRLDYWLAQLLILVFYLMALFVYNRARKEYTGGKIGAAINLILLFMVILFFSDVVDYFFVLFLPFGQDTILIFKILLRLTAICVLFFGGLKFFMRTSSGAGFAPQHEAVSDMPAASPLRFPDVSKQPVKSTVVLENIPQRMPTLGRYEIIEEIGRGAMGIVYKGRDPKLNRLTAIKTLRFGDDFSEEELEKVREQFFHEAEVVAKLSHPNIVTIYDVGEDLDLSYLAMEYLEGESLAAYTKTGNLLPIPECIDIITQACDALEYAHHHGIVHRDIKPANIMRLKSGVVKVTDFGIARATASSKTRTGVIKGTPYYMSPEQARGMKLTGASDIFSLGVVFYQLLTGKLPFIGDSLATIMYQITSVEPESPAVHNPNIDEPILGILNQALEKHLASRYRTAKEMGDQLRRLIALDKFDFNSTI